MTFVAIIGAGDLGGAVAQALASRESATRVLLVDEAAAAAAGQALDIQQMCAITGAQTALRGTADTSEAIGCAVCIVADRFGPGGEWRGDEARPMLTSLHQLIGKAPVILAGVAQSDLLRGAVLDGIARKQIVGSAPEALASAARAIVALEARCAPSEVTLAVLGAPPDGFVVAWSEAAVGGYALAKILTTVQLNRVEARVARLWPPRPYALGLAAATVADSMLRSARRACSVLALLDGELGVRGRVGTVPAFLDSTGITALREPSLSSRERVRLDTFLSR